MRYFPVLAVFIMSAAQAQPGSLFQRYVDQFTGSEWRYEHTMTNPAGEVTFSGVDYRQYRWGMRNRYMIVEVYSEADGERIHVAVELAGFDPATGTVHLSQFWPWQPTKLGDVAAKLHEEESGLVAVRGNATPAGAEYPKLAIDCSMPSKDVYECTTRTTTANGESYVSNRERMQRLAPP